MNILVAVPAKRDMLFRRANDSVLQLDWYGQLDVLYLLGGASDPLAWNVVLKKLNEARILALYGNYDALYVGAGDIIMPPDALQRLAAVDADVVYLLTVLGQTPGHPWNINTSLSEGEMTFLSDNKEAARAAWGQVIDCAGHGCGLIHRRVLEKLEFRTPLPMTYAQDWYLSIDCQREGFTQKADLGVVCGHISVNPLRIYWPDPNEETLYRTEMV
uniref:Uncharacterized protein n=1 Tax=viral metagenome TaxID=1070528 RepID=A0A6M3M1V1_9ZZZZ